MITGVMVFIGSVEQTVEMSFNRTELIALLNDWLLLY